MSDINDARAAIERAQASADKLKKMMEAGLPAKSPPVTSPEFVFWSLQFLLVHWKVTGAIDWGYTLVFFPIEVAVLAFLATRIKWGS